MADEYFPNQPKAIGFFFIDINEITNEAKPMNLNERFATNTVQILENELSMRHLFKVIEDCKINLQISENQ